MVTELLAYHTLIHALEARRGWSPARRFASSITHALNGHLPYRRYHEAGVALERNAAGQDTIEGLVREQLMLDLNFINQAARQSSNMANFIWAANQYNSSVNLGVTTIVQIQPQDNTQRIIRQAHDQQAASHDPRICRLGQWYVMDSQLRQIARNAKTNTKPPITRMSDIARILGLENGVHREASLALEEQGHISITHLAKQLGVHPRTLERRLAQDHLSPEMLRQVARILRALQGISTGENLSAVAIEAGFYDQAHMTRAFRAAGGTTPGVVQKLLAPELVSI